MEVLFKSYKLTRSTHYVVEISLKIILKYNVRNLDNFKSFVKVSILEKNELKILAKRY